MKFVAAMDAPEIDPREGSHGKVQFNYAKFVLLSPEVLSVDSVTKQHITDGDYNGAQQWSTIVSSE